MQGKDDRAPGLSEEAITSFERVFDEANEPPMPVEIPEWAAARPRFPPGLQGRRDRGERPHYWGHRERVRERFAKGGIESMPDYEIVEMLLFNAVPRVDVKPLAKRLLEDFGGFERLLSASDAELGRHPLVDRKIIHQLKLAEAIAIRLARARMAAKPVLGGTEAVVRYCRTAMGYKRIEHFRVLFLDKQHRLIADEEHGRGTVDHTPAYPREIAKRALELNAAGVVLVHNHPSGDPTPSRGDISMTAAIKSALEAVGVALLEHIVIGAESETSFAAQGLL